MVVLQPFVLFGRPGGIQMRAATRSMVFEKAMRLRDMYVNI